MCAYNCVWSTTKLKERSNCSTFCTPVSLDATDTLTTVSLGRNWYTYNGQLGTQLIQFKRSPRDATDTISWPRDATRTSPDMWTLGLRVKVNYNFNIAVHCFKNLYIQSKCSWTWAKLSPETWRAGLKESIKRNLLHLVGYSYHCAVCGRSVVLYW
jgi:hypothetical protein